ncbi:TetR/AcrR family transcriptional regulator [Thalassiella azotivora]
MVANPGRRTQLLDAAIALLGSSGARGLTHRAVDAEAAVPVGTCANYFPRRADLVVGVGERSFELLSPDVQRLEPMAGLAGEDAVVAYTAYVLERLLARPHLALTLIELRLEAARSPEVAERLTPFLREGFAADVAFHQGRELPGGADLVAALHHVVTGVVLDRLTVPLQPDVDPVAAATGIARRLTRGC